MDLCDLKRWLRAEFFAKDRDITLQTGRTFDGDGAFPIGTIMLWYSSIASIPTGWHLCDGTNGTIDLRDRFIPGAGSTYSVGDTGGAQTHTHTVSDTTGNGANSTNISDNVPGPYDSIWSHTHNLSITSGGANHRPPFHALAYVQRIA